MLQLTYACLRPFDAENGFFLRDFEQINQRLRCWRYLAWVAFKRVVTVPAGVQAVCAHNEAGALKVNAGVILMRLAQVYAFRCFEIPMLAVLAACLDDVSALLADMGQLLCAWKAPVSPVHVHHEKAGRLQHHAMAVQKLIAEKLAFFVFQVCKLFGIPARTNLPVRHARVLSDGFACRIAATTSARPVRSDDDLVQGADAPLSS